MNFRAFSHHFILAKLATSSLRVNVILQQSGLDSDGVGGPTGRFRVIAYDDQYPAASPAYPPPTPTPHPGEAAQSADGPG